MSDKPFTVSAPNARGERETWGYWSEGEAIRSARGCAEWVDDLDQIEVVGFDGEAIDWRRNRPMATAATTTVETTYPGPLAYALRQVLAEIEEHPERQYGDVRLKDGGVVTAKLTYGATVERARLRFGEE